MTEKEYDQKLKERIQQLEQLLKNRPMPGVKKPKRSNPPLAAMPLSK
jgi:hypothetical protein